MSRGDSQQGVQSVVNGGLQVVSVINIAWYVWAGATDKLFSKVKYRSAHHY